MMKIIAALVLLSASVSTFGQSLAPKNSLSLDYIFHAAESESLWLPKIAAVEYPKPDFAEMEKYYEMVKYEYGDLAVENELHFWLKPKTERRPQFRVQFLDKDGALICNITCDNGGFYPTGNFSNVPVGTVGKASVFTPKEKEMEKVASVKIIRVKQ